MEFNYLCLSQSHSAADVSWRLDGFGLFLACWHSLAAEWTRLQFLSKILYCFPYTVRRTVTSGLWACFCTWPCEAGYLCMYIRMYVDTYNTEVGNLLTWTQRTVRATGHG